MANTGFPSHGSLHAVFKSLASMYDLIPNKDKNITDATLAWRAMAKSVYELKKHAAVGGAVPDVLKDLVDAIVLPAEANDEGPCLKAAAASKDDASTSTVGQNLTVCEVEKLFQEVDSEGNQTSLTVPRPL